MKFLVDNQLPARLATHLSNLGHDAAHVLALGLDEADDRAVWSHATADGRIVISKDDDFVFLALRPGDSGRLVWVRLGNCRNVDLLAVFDRVIGSICAAFASGQRIVELV